MDFSCIIFIFFKSAIVKMSKNNNKSSLFELSDSNDFKKKWNDELDKVSLGSIKLYIFIASTLFIVPTISRLFIQNDILELITKITYSSGLIIGSLILFLGINLGRISLKNKFENIDVACLFLNILTFAFAIFNPQISFIFILLIWISLYSVSQRSWVFLEKKYFFSNRNNIDRVKSEFELKNWFFWIIPFALTLYYLNFQADITLSKIFLVDPKHFPNTKPLTMMLFLAHYLLWFSFAFILILTVLLIRTKENNKLLTYFSWFFSSLIMLSLSSILIANPEKLIRSYADTVDFNPKSICGLYKPYNGYIYLDPAYKKVLASYVSSDTGKLSSKVKDCLSY